MCNLSLNHVVVDTNAVRDQNVAVDLNCCVFLFYYLRPLHNLVYEVPSTQYGGRNHGLIGCVRHISCDKGKL